MNLLIDYQGEVEKIVTKLGKSLTLYVVYVKLPDEAYPVRLAVFDNPNVPAGKYQVPLSVSLSFDRRRLECRLDFTQAKSIKAAE